MIRTGRSSAALAAVMALAAVCPAGAAAPAHGKRFDGFNPHFNLGQAANGAVCEATRGFDGPLVDEGARVWNVTCRGWSNTLGNLYLFPASKARGADTAWRKQLTARTDCASSKMRSTHQSGLGEKRSCKTLAANLGYVVYRSESGGRIVAAEGRAPIDDVLAKGVRFLSGSVPEPQAIDKQAAAVSQVSTAKVSELGATDAAERSE